MGYLHANFSLPRPLCSGVRPNICDRQTDRRQTDRCNTKASLNASALCEWRHNNIQHIELDDDDDDDDDDVFFRLHTWYTFSLRVSSPYRTFSHT